MPVRTDLTWGEFVVCYLSSRKGQIADSTLAQFGSASAWIPHHMLLANVDGHYLSRLRDRIRKERSAVTARSYTKMLLAAINWAADQGYTTVRPRVPMDRGAGGRAARSRAVTEEEYRLVLEAAGSPELRFAIQCLWHSGFRASEVVQLSWTPGENWSFDDSGRLPVVRITRQKNSRTQLQPITREFWQLVLPTRERGGRVIQGYTRADSLSAAVARAGRAAGVVTNSATGKTATSHDLGRRAFATRMAAVMSTTELAIWMRHGSIDTTMRYYYQPEVQRLASKVWSC